MPQSLSNVLIHVVFSTKDRTKVITPEIETELHPYLASICRSLDCPSLNVGGTDDHVHILCRLARTVSVSKAVEKIKTGSSKWIKTKHNRYQSFGWQNGYGAFSIGASQIDVLRKYISNQREHHRKRTFQEEFRELCEKYNIEYDERYVWN